MKRRSFSLGIPNDSQIFGVNGKKTAENEKLRSTPGAVNWPRSINYTTKQTEMNNKQSKRSNWLSQTNGKESSLDQRRQVQNARACLL